MSTSMDSVGSVEGSTEDSMEVMEGENALISVADLLYERMRGEPLLEELVENTDLLQLARQLRRFLGCVFGTDEWPAIRVSHVLVERRFKSLLKVLLEALRQPAIAAEENPLPAAVGMLSQEYLEDERVVAFLEEIRSAKVEQDAAAAEPAEQEPAGVADPDIMEADDVVPDESKAADRPADDQVADDSAASQGPAGQGPGYDANGINVHSFGELELPQHIIRAAQDCWRQFLATARTREAAGEAIYSALFEAAPTFQKLFTTPRAVQALRFMAGLNGFVTELSDPPKLKVLVETLGFVHLHLDVTVPWVVIFRDALLDLFHVELAEKFTPQAAEGWKTLLNYVGGAIIFVKAHYAERIQCLLKSWAVCNHNKDDTKVVGDDSASQGSEETNQQRLQAVEKKGWLFGRRKQKDVEEHYGNVHSEQVEKEVVSESLNFGSQKVPTTYPEMFLFNAAVMGFGTSAWMNEVLDCFHNIVVNVSNSARLQQECDVLALRISKSTKGTVNFAEYKSCMLASLRSLLPRDWDSLHEVAWTWLWENVERLLLKIMGSPPRWEKALGKFLDGLDEDQKYDARKEIYARFFAVAPAGQDFFKQSNTYLHFIAEKIIQMTLELYRDPTKMVDDISALGLRHVGYGIPTELFGPFCTACIEVVMTLTKDTTTVEAFRWSLGLIANVLCRTITEGSTIVMTSINANSQRLFRKAISCAPRGERAQWMLLVQVGTQNISPLAWAIESGAFEAATAIIKDLLTIRADRDRYYFGVDDLFKRHPDIVNNLCQNAMNILPTLLDGLIWRSRLTEAGFRRVNYFVKHLLLDEEGDFSQTLSWITKAKDPIIVRHPVIVMVADMVWTRVASITFFYGKSWFLFTLLLFVTSQSILENANKGERTDWERDLVAICRTFIYGCSMTHLIYCHSRDTFKAFRNSTVFRLGCMWVPNYLKKWQETASFMLAVSLILMFCLEPLAMCAKHSEGKRFYQMCEEASGTRWLYTFFSMTAMYLYFALLLDLAVISMRVSAFMLVCIRMLPELMLFLGALFTMTLTFASAISVLRHDIHDFAGIDKGCYALVRMVLQMYSASKYELLEDEPVVLAAIFLFMVAGIIFLLNLFIAQLSCAYSSVNEDMIGFARLERAEIIVEIMPSVPKVRWQKFTKELRLHKRLEFNEGDVGLAGGIQVREPAAANPTTIDAIRRFGGSTSQDIAWPEEESMDEDNRFARMEKLLERAIKQIGITDKDEQGGAGGGGSSGDSGERGGSEGSLSGEGAE